MSWNASASSSEQDWAQVRARRQERHANRSTLRRKTEWICKKCAAACFMSYQTCRKCYAARDGTEEVVPGLDMTTGKAQPTTQAKGHEPASSKAAPKKPSQLEQARTALQNAKSAGLPQGVIASLEHEVEKLVVLTAEARPIGAQIDAAKARLARALKAEEQLKERWLSLEEQVKANQQEKNSAQAALEELTSKAKMELERGGDHNHLEAALEQILELIESMWPAGHVAPRVNEMVHQARTVLERSRSRSADRSKKRNTSGSGTAGDRHHVEKEEEHGAADGLDLSIDYGEQDESPVQYPTEWYTKMQRLAKEDDVTIARTVRASVQGGTGQGC